MKVFELIARLQQMPPQADAYLSWWEWNDSGTQYETGVAVTDVRKADNGPMWGRAKTNGDDIVVIA